ncbi:PREDICTED: uncharacterized protein LOC107098124 isoform X2 [Cyprinodon variegatus]|uniref:Interferon gamma receptor 1-like n=1 Tax=Cyprinodon variegatus TaxID=28743 RepID=A0A3Q2DDK2_CYPVA|nr:interferon gamma receptor 1-like precursor [Cyprinodon variegatus]
MIRTLFLLCFPLFPFVSPAQVAPPTNVTLTCRNQKNILKWDYDQPPDQGLRFRVNITSDNPLKGCKDELWVDYPDLQADVSFLSDPDNTYMLQVKAVLGQNESDVSPQEGLIFSYFYGSLLAQNKCLLDLPPVNITYLSNTKIHLQFRHPWLLYGEGVSRCNNENEKKKKKKKSHSKRTAYIHVPVFSYNVQMVGQNKQHNFDCEEEMCEENLSVDAAQDEHCLTIEGKLRKMSVVSTEDYCITKQPPSNNQTGVYVGTFVGILVVLAAALIAFMVYRKKTSPSSDILPLFFGIQKRQPPFFQPLNDQVSPTEAFPVVSPKSTEEREEESVSPSQDASKEDDEHLKLSTDNEELEGGQATGEQDPYMCDKFNEGDDPESDQENVSPYESHPVVLELAPEDRAEGYRG